jgi:hypothetical protein
MISTEEKKKIVWIRLKEFKGSLNNLASDNSTLEPGDPQIDINALEYANLVRRIKSLENELILLTNNDQ